LRGGILRGGTLRGASCEAGSLSGIDAEEGQMPIPKNANREKLSEVGLAMLYLTSFTDATVVRAWKGLDWDLLDLLHEQGWIADPKGKTKSVVLTEEGARLSEEFFTRHFAPSKKQGA
jgi:hypothetical protein